MLKNATAFSSFSVNDLAKAQEFYGQTLGLEVVEEKYGSLTVKLGGGAQVMVYPKDNHEPASYTALNFIVEDIEPVMEELKAKGVTFEQYDLPGIKTNEQGISEDADMGLKMAWFKDPAGNIIALMQTQN